jgi:hypothetical protein
MKQREVREEKIFWRKKYLGREGGSGVLCLERIRVMQGLRSNHGTSLDRFEFPRVHDAREREKR